MKLVKYEVEIAAFEDESIPSKDIMESALEECVENIETNGGNVTVRASYIGETEMIAVEKPKHDSK